MLSKLFSHDTLDPYLLVGLGNPGREYEQTRHNIGFLAVDAIAHHWGVNMRRSKHKSLYGEYRSKEFRALLMIPQTFMNLSGEAVYSFVRYHKIQAGKLMVIFDDLDLPFGEIRIRESGGSSGQRGMKSIIEKLGTNEFPRMRVGIGRPPGKKDPVDFILDTFDKREKRSLELILDACVQAVECFIHHGIARAMTAFNHSILEDE